ncbi:MAG: hypothetical protein L6R28_18965 [Planctomycetes bacterium]|nr:hypothetical protein [Planctomycetota bacterium]
MLLREPSPSPALLAGDPPLAAPKAASRRRVLFVGEGVTLAHVVRPLEMASQLDPAEFDVLFACDARYEGLVREKGLAHVALPCIDPADFKRRVYKAEALYTVDELRRQAGDDLRLLEAWRPQLVVGDFRLSLGISAERAGTPHIAFSNAHWSPSARLECPVPDHPLVGILGVSVMKRLLPLASPWFFRRQLKAFNRVRAEHGLAPLGGRGAHEVFTRGTRTVYLDIPQLYGLGELSVTESFIGPVQWSPSARLPEAWAASCRRGPVVFAYPGSSGDALGTLHLVRAAAALGATVLLAGIKQPQRGDLPPKVLAADVIPAGPAACLADLVICNGGSPMVYHALSAGKPVLGVPVNLDQHFVMDAVSRHGAGRVLRPGQCRSKDASAVLRALLGDDAARQAAASLKTYIDAFDPLGEFLHVVDELVPALALRTENGHAA